MSKLAWHEPGTKIYETGLDRGVLYTSLANVPVDLPCIEVEIANGITDGSPDPGDYGEPLGGWPVGSLVLDYGYLSSGPTALSTPYLGKVWAVWDEDAGIYYDVHDSSLINPGNEYAPTTEEPSFDYWRTDRAYDVTFADNEHVALAETVELVAHIATTGGGTQQLWFTYMDETNQQAWVPMTLSPDEHDENLEFKEYTVVIPNLTGQAIAFGNMSARIAETGASFATFRMSYLALRAYVPAENRGIPWNGLVSINEASSGGEAKAYHYDGVKYVETVAGENFQATLSAYSHPDAFAPFDGLRELLPGVFLTRQPRKTFGLSFRTLVGNEIEGDALGYKIHLLYNVTASPSQRMNQSMTQQGIPINFEWPINAVPDRSGCHKPTPYFVVDSREINAEALQALEDILYGTELTVARLPTQREVILLLADIGGYTLPDCYYNEEICKSINFNAGVVDEYVDTFGGPPYDSQYRGYYTDGYNDTVGLTGDRISGQRARAYLGFFDGDPIDDVPANYTRGSFTVKTKLDVDVAIPSSVNNSAYVLAVYGSIDGDYHEQVGVLSIGLNFGGLRQIEWQTAEDSWGALLSNDIIPDTWYNCRVDWDSSELRIHVENADNPNDVRMHHTMSIPANWKIVPVAEFAAGPVARGAVMAYTDVGMISIDDAKVCVIGRESPWETIPLTELTLGTNSSTGAGTPYGVIDSNGHLVKNVSGGLNPNTSFHFWHPSFLVTDDPDFEVTYRLTFVGPYTDVEVFSMTAPTHESSWNSDWYTYFYDGTPSGNVHQAPGGIREITFGPNVETNVDGWPEPGWHFEMAQLAGELYYQMDIGPGSKLVKLERKL